MNVVVFGATGNIGSAITRELVARGHRVTAASRRGDPIDDLDVATERADVTDAAQVAHVAAGQDAIVSAVGPRYGSDTEQPFVDAAHALVGGARKAGVPRLVVVGGAGSLEIAPGTRLVDSPGFHEEWKPNALAQAEALEVYRAVDDLDWTYVSPAALIEPGERVGHYRRGGDELLVDEHGTSRITYPDYAIAIADTLERDDAYRRRITVAY
jgi:putative NADH-flavin reductase